MESRELVNLQGYSGHNSNSQMTHNTKAWGMAKEAPVVGQPMLPADVENFPSTLQVPPLVQVPTAGLNVNINLVDYNKIQSPPVQAPAVGLIIHISLLSLNSSHTGGSVEAMTFNRAGNFLCI